MVERALASGAPLPVSEIANAYARMGDAWTSGPSVFYDRLADHIVATAGMDLRGKTVLDVGAGTGAVCRALSRVHARPVAVDTALDMLTHVGGVAIAVAGDMLVLPFRDAAFGAAVAAFAISHVKTPETALGEMCRVVRTTGLVVAAVFGESEPDPSKDAVDGAARAFGYMAPAWHDALKTELEPLTNTPERLAACAATAGLDRIRIDDSAVETGVDTPQKIVAYRTGMAHLAPFVTSLDVTTRESFMSRATDATARVCQPLRPRVLTLVASRSMTPRA